MQEQGVMKGLLAFLNQPNEVASNRSPTTASGSLVTPLATSIVHGHRYLHVKLRGGRAFIESLIDEEIQVLDCEVFSFFALLIFAAPRAPAFSHQRLRMCSLQVAALSISTRAVYCRASVCRFVSFRPSGGLKFLL